MLLVSYTLTTAWRGVGSNSGHEVPFCQGYFSKDTAAVSREQPLLPAAGGLGRSTEDNGSTSLQSYRFFCP